MPSTKHTSRITPSLVLSLIAIVLALIGTASAATGFFTGQNIKDGTLTYRDIKPSSIRLDRLDKSTRYLISTRTGTPAVAASNGLRTIVIAARADIPAGGRVMRGAACPSGMIALGGGAQVGESASRPDVVQPSPEGPPPAAVSSSVDWAAPTSDGHGWIAEAHTDGAGQTLSVLLICSPGEVGLDH